ncbi:MAG: DUF1343 domain-containing protein [Candidatus Krumholzibacteriota bacterium]|nr:DUF1343 domain-containing protein [Candidatus Krumholzibacteriota bacterium]
MVKTGCDILAGGKCARLRGKRTGVLANPASVTSDLRHITEILQSNKIELKAIFGPQHGFAGETQANMIEWESYEQPGSGIPVYSLYGKTREPTDEMLSGLEQILIDLPDIGTRCYTYLWTAALMLKACAEKGIKVIIADRPNPIGGESVEGTVIDRGFESFVGLFPLTIRHGLTIGEALTMINENEDKKCELDIIRISGWKRSMHFRDTSLRWIMPSPNIPRAGTALLYPGMVLLEGTNISEGRGTARPFEIIGAPWIDPRALADELTKRAPGAIFRPLRFNPTWDKYRGEICGGVQIHITDRERFKPVRTGALAIRTAASLYPGEFEWTRPPYEYEREKMPIDIITGSDSFRNTINRGAGLKELFESWLEDEREFKEESNNFFLY